MQVSKTMTSKISTKSRLLSTVAFLFLFATVGFSQQATKDCLAQRIIAFEKTGTVHVILQTLAQKYRVHVGFENIPEGMKPSVLNINVQDSTLRGILNEITKADPRYEWEESRGVVNVFPRNTKETLSLILVKQFHMEDKNREDISQSVTSTPEVQTFLLNKGIRRYDIDEVSENPAPLPHFSLTLENVTLQEILNSTLIKSDSYYWVIYRYGK